MIHDNEFKNVKNEKDQITGFQIGVRITYYRGVFLALIKNFEVTVDGVTYKKGDMTFTVNGHTYTFDEMIGKVDEHWEFGDVAILTINKPDGLAKGEHDVTVVEEIRVCYGLMPVPIHNSAKWNKKLSINV